MSIFGFYCLHSMVYKIVMNNFGSKLYSSVESILANLTKKLESEVKQLQEDDLLHCLGQMWKNISTLEKKIRDSLWYLV